MKLNFQLNMLLLYTISVIELTKKSTPYVIVISILSLLEPISRLLFDIERKKRKRKESNLLMDRLHVFNSKIVQ